MKTLRIYRLLEILNEDLAYIAHLAKCICDDFVSYKINGGAARRKAEELKVRFDVVCARILSLCSGLRETVSNKMATSINANYTLCNDKLNWLLLDEPAPNHIRTIFIYEK